MSDGYWLISIRKDSFKKHPDHVFMLGLSGTTYNWADDNESAQLVGAHGEKIYWVSPESQAYQVVRDLNKHTGEKPHVQRSIPPDFTPQMRDHVRALGARLYHRSEFDIPQSRTGGC